MITGKRIKRESLENMVAYETTKGYSGVGSTHRSVSCTWDVKREEGVPIIIICFGVSPMSMISHDVHPAIKKGDVVHTSFTIQKCIQKKFTVREVAGVGISPRALARPLTYH